LTEQSEGCFLNGSSRRWVIRQFEFEHSLKDGKKLAKEKIRKIESNIDSIFRILFFPLGVIFYF